MPKLCDNEYSANTADWFCPICGYRTDRPFRRECGEVTEGESVRRAKRAARDGTKFQERSGWEDRLKRAIEKTGQVRTLEEALTLYDKCKQCEHFGGHRCRKDSGCDASTVFLIRLAKRNCPEWG